jgi:hypothetical protein
MSKHEWPVDGMVGVHGFKSMGKIGVDEGD